MAAKLSHLMLLAPLLLLGNRQPVMSTDCAVDLTRIGPKKVRQWLADNGLCRPADFAGLQPACYEEDVDSTFLFHTVSYRVDCPPEQAWRAYKAISPREAWSGRMLSFGLMYSRQGGAISYADDPYAGAEIGQVIFLNLSLFGGLHQLAVAHEVTEVNEEERYLQTCYLTTGKSHGTQRIRLEESPDGGTLIIHDTYYRSDSKFRDEKLYPKLHTQAVSEFHSNVIRKIKEEQ